MSCAPKILLMTQQGTHVPPVHGKLTGMMVKHSHGKTYKWQSLPGEEGEKHSGGIAVEKQHSSTLLLKSPSDNPLQTRSVNAMTYFCPHDPLSSPNASYTQNFANNQNRYKNVTFIEMFDKEPMTCKNIQATKPLTLTHVTSKHTRGPNHQRHQHDGNEWMGRGGRRERPC